MAALVVLASGCGGSPPTTPTPPPPTPQLALTCPSAVETSSLGGAPVTVSYAAPVPTGGSTPVQVTCAPGSGAMFTAGTTSVDCTAADSAGRQASCAFDVKVVAIPQLQKTRFMAFGDSLTEGKLSAFLPLLFDAGPQSYPSQLQRLMTERYALQQVVVVNEGYGGERADASFARFSDALRTHRPDVALLMHGVNDLNGPTAGKVQTTVDALEELGKMARGAGVTPFIATLPPLGPPKGSCPECVDPLNERIRSMTAAKGFVLVDVHDAWGGRSGLMGADGIHPTEAGYDVIARTFLDAIRKTFEAAPPGGLR